MLDYVGRHGAPPDGATLLVCDEVATGDQVVVLVGDDPVADATTAAESALATLTVAPPDARTAPPPDGLLLTGLRTWFWDANTAGLSATATLPGLAATVTIAPASTTVITDGATVTCPGGGVPYDTGRPGREQDQTCTHVYATAGTHRVTIATTWTVTWSATNGTSGTLPDLIRTTTFPLQVRSAEAVTD